jgi:hypothetical protein
MPIACRIDRKRGLIATAITGAWNRIDFEKCLDSFFSNPDFVSELRGLIDLRQATEGSSTEELKALAASLRARYVGSKSARCAILVADDQTFSAMRVFEAHAAGGPFQYSTFQDEDEAFEWLKLA